MMKALKTKVEITSLRNYLEELSKIELDSLFKELLSDDESEIKRLDRREKIDILYENIIADYDGYFYIINEEKKEKFRKIFTDKKVDNVANELFDFTIMVKKDNCYLLFEEAIDRFEHFLNDDVIEANKKLFFTYYLKNNGLLEKHKLKELMSESGVPITDEEIEKYVSLFEV